MQRLLKRFVDVTIAGAVLLVLAPVLAVVAVLIAFFMGRPVFFRQKRPGLNGKPIEVVKFRTMTDSHQQEQSVASSEKRITPLGRMLRRFSIDELPQLWNVIRGDMSLVGPRPLLMDYMELYTAEQLRRHSMRPGLTGLAQINGRQNLKFSQRIELDLWYIDHWSLALDAKILIQTAKRFLGMTEVNPDTSTGRINDLVKHQPHDGTEE